MSPTYRGGYLPFTRGYAYRSASTQAHEMDRNLMFFYEHQNLYDPDQARRRTSGSSDSSRESRLRYGSSRETQDVVPVNAPPSPPRTPSPAPVLEVNKPLAETEAEPEQEEENEREDTATPLAGASPLAIAPSTDSINQEEAEEDEECEGTATPLVHEAAEVSDEVNERDLPRASISTDDVPPSYRAPSVHPPTYQNYHSTTLLEASCPPELVDTLRRFLLFCLAIDYDLVSSCPELLDQADWIPFMRLARHWSWRDSRARYQQGYDPVRPAFLGNPGTSDAAEDDERALRIEQCIFAVVVKPALALGVPADIAITMLRQFPTSMTSSGTHLPLHHRYRSPSTKALATKLLLDREILFDTVTQHRHQAFRSALHEANEHIVNKHFVKLRSPDDYELTQFGLNREKLEGRNLIEGLGKLEGDGFERFSGQQKGRRRFSRWVRKLSST